MTNAIFQSDVMLKTRLTSIYTIKHQEEGATELSIARNQKTATPKGRYLNCLWVNECPFGSQRTNIGCNL